MVEGTRIKVIGEECGETEGCGGPVVLGDSWFCCVRSFTVAMSRGEFFVVIRNVISD